jgi:hypothetical protein
MKYLDLFKEMALFFKIHLQIRNETIAVFLLKDNYKKRG